MTLTWHSHPLGEAKATLIWRAFVIVMAILVHLLLSARAQANETIMPMPMASHISLDAHGARETREQGLLPDLTPAFFRSIMVQTKAGHSLLFARDCGRRFAMHKERLE